MPYNTSRQVQPSNGSQPMSSSYQSGQQPQGGGGQPKPQQKPLTRDYSTSGYASDYAQPNTWNEKPGGVAAGMEGSGGGGFGG